MNNEFDELTKNMAQSVTRRGALKKFGGGLVAAIAASPRDRQFVAPRRGYCQVNGVADPFGYTGRCVDTSTCQWGTNSNCSGYKIHAGKLINDASGGQSAPLSWGELTKSLA